MSWAGVLPAGAAVACRLRSAQQVALMACALLHQHSPGGRILHRCSGLVCCLQALLPPGMAELLRLAAEGGAEGAGPWPRVHAFNTLRLAFIERILAISATPFVADGACATLVPCWCVWTVVAQSGLEPSCHACHIAGTECVH